MISLEFKLRNSFERLPNYSIIRDNLLLEFMNAKFIERSDSYSVLKFPEFIQVPFCHWDLHNQCVQEAIPNLLVH